jgi:hypothetical protein
MWAVLVVFLLMCLAMLLIAVSLTGRDSNIAFDALDKLKWFGRFFFVAGPVFTIWARRVRARHPAPPAPRTYPLCLNRP